MEIVKGRDTPEYNFFIYALPALSSCAKHLGEEKLGELRKLVIGGFAPSWNEQEKLTPAAHRRAKDFVGPNYRDSVEGTDGYWEVGHNELIHKGLDGYGHALPEQKEDCMVSFWQVMGIRKTERGIIYALKDKKMRLWPALNPNGLEVRAGDFVSTHHHEIVKKITKEKFEKYGENPYFR